MRFENEILVRRAVSTASAFVDLGQRILVLAFFQQLLRGLQRFTDLGAQGFLRLCRPAASISAATNNRAFPVMALT